MEMIFLNILNMSITASYLVLAVMTLRLLCRKAPRWLTCSLWALVGLRLMVPIRFRSVLSLLPGGETLPQNMFTAAKPQITSGIEGVDRVVNPVLAESLAPAELTSINPSQVWGFVLSHLWVMGVAVMLLYVVVSFFLLRRRVRTAVRVEENVYESEFVLSPFVLGVFRPVIYLPYHLDSADCEYVLAHERAHIARRDHWWKPLGFLLLTVYWFNPLLWVAYVLLCRDIEAACDERVIRGMEKEGRRAYSTALLNCSTHRRGIAACPLAFGEVGVKARIQNVMNYKKPAFWVVLLAVIASLAVAVGFLTDPKEEVPYGTDLSEYSLAQAKADGCVVMEDGDVTYGQGIWADFVAAAERGEAATVRYAQYYTVGDPSRYDPDHYEEIKDRYPMMFVHTLTFDGETYTDTWKENGEEISRVYLYLMHFEGVPESSTAQYERYDKYVLTNDNTVTWEELFYSLASSQAGSAIDHLVTYSDYIYGGEDPRIDWQLTLGDVISLSRKGDELTWEDFEGYYHIVTGSGLYIRQYPIDDLFGLMIGGGEPSGKPIYIYLQSSFTSDGFIDIRNEDVEKFIREQRALQAEYLAQNDPLPEDYPKGFIFASGAGAWGTSLTLYPDGSFLGSYHDSEMGLNGEGYPNGTVYTSEFSGRFGSIRKINDWSYALTLTEITTTDAVGEEYFSDGIRFVAAEPHGLTGGTEFILYTPETPTAELNEEFLSWNHGGYIWIEEGHETLGCYAIRNLATEHGFYSD